MKTTTESPRRNFLALIAAGAASLGIATPSFGNSSAGQAGQDDRGANVRRYGAVGDGKKDDTAAIQKAVDAGLGSVYFPRGAYRISKTIEITLDKIGYTSLLGDGSAKIIASAAGPVFRFTGTHEKSAAPSTFSPNVWDRQRMPVVENIAIVGDHPEAEGIEARGTMQLTISRLHVRKVLHAIHLKGNNRNLSISDCHIYENRGIGIFYDDVNLHQSNITGCHISYNSLGGIVSRGGNVRNIQITGCDIESNMGENGPPSANILIDCSTSEWGTAEVAVTGCTVQHNSESPDSANIRIIGGRMEGSPAVLKRWGNVTITGNIMSDVMVNVHLKDCRGVTISNNTFWEGFRHHLLLERCTNLAIGTNIFDNSPNINRRTLPVNSLRVINCEDCNFTGLQIIHAKDQAALTIENSRRMIIANCTILDCSNTGLMLKGVSDSVVTGCLIRNDLETSGFKALSEQDSSGNLIVNNLIS